MAEEVHRKHTVDERDYKHDQKGLQKKDEKKRKEKEVHRKHTVDERDFAHDSKGLQEGKYKEIRKCIYVCVCVCMCFYVCVVY